MYGNYVNAPGYRSVAVEAAMTVATRLLTCCMGGKHDEN